MAISLLRYHQEATVSHLFDFCEEKALLHQSPKIKKSISRGDVHPNRVAVYPISTYKNKSGCTAVTNSSSEG